MYIIKRSKSSSSSTNMARIGAKVRQKTKAITKTLARLRQERLSRANMRDRMLSQPRQEVNDEPLVGGESSSRRATAAVGNVNLRCTIEEGKRTFTAEQARGVEVANLARFSTAPLFVQLSYSPLERLTLSIEGIIASTGETLAPDTDEMLS